MWGRSQTETKAESMCCMLEMFFSTVVRLTFLLFAVCAQATDTFILLFHFYKHSQGFSFLFYVDRLQHQIFLPISTDEFFRLPVSHNALEQGKLDNEVYWCEMKTSTSRVISLKAQCVLMKARGLRSKVACVESFCSALAVRDQAATVGGGKPSFHQHVSAY